VTGRAGRAALALAERVAAAIEATV